jgi:hypothetical protein
VKGASGLRRDASQGDEKGDQQSHAVIVTLAASGMAHERMRAAGSSFHDLERGASPQIRNTWTVAHWINSAPFH